MFKPKHHALLLTLAALAVTGCSVNPYHNGRYDDHAQYHGAGYEAEYSGGYRKGVVESAEPVYREYDAHSGHLPDYYKIDVKLDGGERVTTKWLYEPGLAPNDPVEIRRGYAYLLDTGNTRS